MSDYIQENQSKYGKRVKIERIKEQPTYPLSSAQKRIYYNAKMIGNDNVVYKHAGWNNCRWNIRHRKNKKSI